MAAGGRAPDTASLEGRAWQVLLLLLISTGVVVRAEQSDSDLLKQSVIQRKLQLRYADQVAKYIERWSGYKQLDAIQPTRGEKSSSGQALRLVSGSGPWEGMVEVYDEGRWKRLKANRWSERETRVVCRQLGYISLFSKFPSTLRSRDRFARKASLAMEIDKCSGGESSVMQCSRARVTADTEVGVSCYTADDLSSRCADSEIPYADRCYYFGRERVTRLKAGIRCQQRGATLVHVTSQAKNDFLSGVMLARGMSGLHTSGYGEALDGSTRLWFWRNSTKQFLYNNWSPVTASVGGDTDSFQPRCLTLRISNLEDGSKYALWESSLCSDRLDFVCESKRSWRECMSGNGALYAGNISTSESDRVCLPWASVSQYPGLTSPTLKDNYCRNPDNDQRPWCFTSSDSFEYCDIPICPPFLPQPERKSRVLCDNDSFRCSENDCVPASYVCDGDQDCGNNRDEIICQALPYSYQVFPNNDLRVQGDFEGLSRYTGRTLRNCQYVCLVDPDCRLFVYFEDESMCITTSTRLGEAWPTRMSGHTVYAVLSRYQPCLGHRCDNFQCLNTTTAGLSFSAVARAGAGSLRCDGTTDCDDLSDEKHCSDDYGFALRLSDGDGPGSGRLEARIRGRWGAVCDDLFDIDAAFVACRQLGFRRPLQFYVNGRGFASSSSSKSVQYTVNGVLCLGNETSLAECTLLQKPGLCVPGETVALHCTDQPSLCSAAVNSYQCLDGSGCVTQPFMCSKQNSCDDGSDESEDVCENAQFRLEPGSEPRYLTVKPPGRFFRNITAYNFDSVAANYVCSRLAAGGYGVAYRGDDVADSQQMAVLSCTTASSSDTSCDVTAENQLLPRTAVRLFCRQLAPPAVQVRLKRGAEVGGTEGVVELMPPLGQWGLLCSLSFTQQQAEVICRQLGFRGRVSYQVQPRNPDSRVSALAMDCFGDESDISQCLHTAWMNHTGPKACNGSEQVYVTCGLPPPSEPANLQVTPLCSDRKADLSRILGGSVGEISDNAWFAHVDVRQAGERRLKCGASVVSARFVLTAAHCLFGTAIGAATTPAGGHLQLSRQPFPAEQLSVVVGDSGSAVIDPGQRQVGVRRVFRHPAHRALNIYHNDIALLQLAEPLVFTENVRPACLPPPTLPYSAELTCRVVGLGKLAPGLFGQLPGRLQTGAVSFFTRSQCVSFYGRANITAGMVCAGDDRFRVDTCDGDSGGPLTCRVAGVNVVMGVTSWGHGCGRSDFPGVYTKVTHYLDWIHHVVTHN